MSENNKRLTKENLKQYLLTNSEFYEKYLGKYQENRNFISWNWAAVLVPQFWLPYRRMWGLYGVLFIAHALTMLLTYMTLFQRRTASPYFTLSVVIVSLCLLLFMALRANSIILRDVEENLHNKNDGKNKWWIVLVAAILFSLPNIIVINSLNSSNY